MLLATYTLWRRDIVRFLRQRSRVGGALGTPIIFWFLLGSGLGSSFRIGPDPSLTTGYLEYFYPGTIALIVLFTAIFSTISVIEDRHEGFLQGVLVAPVPRSAIVLAKLLGGSTLSILQVTLFLLLAPVAHVRLDAQDIPLLLVILVLLAFALTGLGFLLAWAIDSVQGFHAMMNLLLIPMWLLSGAVFPASGAAGWIRIVMAINPLTYGVSALRIVLSSDIPLSAHHPGEPSLLFSLALIGGFAIAVAGASVVLVDRRSTV